MKDQLQTLLSRPLDETETAKVFRLLMQGGEEAATDAQIGAYLQATAHRLPTVDELTAAVRVLREHMVKIELALDGRELLDTAGTGGSGMDTFNTSTAAAFVCAGAGQPIAKHGNRAATSRCGSADVLEALGIRIDLEPTEVAACAAETGFCFMFAPRHHPATKRVALIRRELGFRTIFNFLGPLSNPAGARCQLLGVSEPLMLPIFAEALVRLGTKRALIVRGDDGLDELTLTGPSLVYEIGESRIRHYRITPEEMGLGRVDLQSICGGAPLQCAEIIRDLFDGSAGPYRDLVLLNAGAALYAAGCVVSIKEGIDRARESIDTGSARAVLARVIEATRNRGNKERA